MAANIKPEKRQQVYEKYSGRCAYCGCFLNPKSMTIDHIIPKSKGGSNAIENLNPSCKRCNNRKANLSLIKFAKELQKLETKEELCRQLSWLIDGNIAKSSNVIARCNFPLNQGYLTKNLICVHKCIEKECYFFEKLSDGWWRFVDETQKEKWVILL